MIGIVYSAMSTVEMPTLERCSNLTIYPECVQPHWPASSKKAASAMNFIICMPAPLLSRRAGQASPRCVSSPSPIPYRLLACQTRTSGCQSQKLQCLRTLLSSRPSSSCSRRPKCARRPCSPASRDLEQTS